MNCPACNLPTDEGAAFCGNCGHAVAAALTAPVHSNNPSLGGTVLAQSSHHRRLNLALMFGIVGIVGALLMPLIGIILGIAGIVLVTTAPRSRSRKLALAAGLLSIIAVLASLGSWVYAVNHHTPDSSTEDVSSNAVSATQTAETPCYSLRFATPLYIQHNLGSCALNASSNPNLDASAIVYRVLVTATTNMSSEDFAMLAKQALDKDVHDNLPKFVITSEQSGMFAGSTAYFVQAADVSGNAAVEEVAVLHSTNGETNFYILVHASKGVTTNVSQLQTNWEWQ